MKTTVLDLRKQRGRERFTRTPGGVVMRKLMRDLRSWLEALS